MFGIDMRLITVTLGLIFPIAMSIDAYRRQQDRGFMICFSAILYFTLGFLICFVLMTPGLKV